MPVFEYLIDAIVWWAAMIILVPLTLLLIGDLVYTWLLELIRTWLQDNSM